jgi:hypothetical protein
MPAVAVEDVLTKAQKAATAAPVAEVVAVHMEDLAIL